MNPGITEEGGATARSLIDSLKSNPGLLVLVVFFIIFVAAVLYAGSQQRKLMEELIQHQKEYAVMLYNCTPNTERQLRQ